jgi:drug/metabolite transporter (DMT)-like permease
MRPQTVGVACVLGATACWGVGTVLSKQALDRGLAPLTLLAVELVASSALLGTFAGVRRARGDVAERPDRRLVLLGLLNPGLAYLLGLLGLLTVSASLSVLLWATEPVLILLLAVAWLGERLTPVTTAATLVAVLGAVLVVLRPGATGDARGIALSVAAVTACACYTVLTRRLLLDDGTVGVVLSQQVVALALVVVVLGVTAAAGIGTGGAVEPSAWGFAVASGVVYYGLAFTAYVAGLRRLPADVAGSLLPAIPVFGLAAAYLTGDRLSPVQWVGVALVVAGTTTAALWHLRRTPEAAAAPSA